MTDRCEPPPELRDRDGWHWLTSDETTVIALEWIADRNAWWSSGYVSELRAAKSFGWRYVAPVTPPEEVAALRERVVKLENSLRAVPEFFKEPKFGAIDPESWAFTELTARMDHPLGHRARWIGGTQDYELVRAVVAVALTAAREPAKVKDAG